MKHRILAILLAMCMVFGMLPTAFAEEPVSSPVAQITLDGEITYYHSLALAVAAVPDGGTITLTADVAGTVAISREVVFRLDAGPYHCELQAGFGFQMTVEGDLYIVAAVPVTMPELHRVNIVAAVGGIVVAGPSIAAAGAAVLLTVTPDEGCTLIGLTVTDAAGGTVAVIALGQGIYLLRMPDCDITVSAVFQEITVISEEDPSDEDSPAAEFTDEACPRDESCPAAAFTDLDLSLWYHDGIHYTVEHHLMNGTDEHRFSPHSATNRAMLVTVLFRLEGAQCTAQRTFTDVEEGAWYAEAVTWAAANGIVEGYGGGRFGPKDPITREQMATILWRYAAYRGYDVSATGDLSVLIDGNDTAQWARRGMEWAVGTGLIVGKENLRLDPQGYAVRSEFATIMMRFCTTVTQ
ncbi:MAG: S-layer homology domain-containing protein [Faecousia sp.]